MIQLHMYLNEINDFLRTLTIKDTLVADQMLNAWVNDDYKPIVEQSITAHPYYRQLLGEYIVFDHKEIRPVIENLYDKGHLLLRKRKNDTRSKEEIIDYVLNTIFPLETKITWRSPYTSELVTRVVPNKQLYRYCNKVPVIYSYDTQTQIPYTKEFIHKNDLGIRSHANTTAVYKIPQSRYIKLLSRYPAESEIIKGVTYPINLNRKKAIETLESAENFSILSYDESLLESTEYQSLIDCVSNTLAMIRRRYAVEGLGYENLYSPAHYYLIWQILYLALFSQRIMNIKSGNVHSYHIWKYLKSHGFEDYRDILSITQQKFLYKNLLYLNKHKGTQHALELLTYVFLTTKNMSLQAKNLMQSVDNEYGVTTETARKYPIVQSIQVADPSIKEINSMKRKSRVRFEKILHYLGQNAGDAKLTDEQEYLGGVTEDIYELYQRERAAKLEYQDDYLFDKSTNRHTELMTYSPVSHLNTKLLEIKSNKTINDYAAIYTKFIAESLLYLAANDQLNFEVSVQLANSSRLITLLAKEWVGMIFYALNKIENNIGKNVNNNLGKHISYNQNDPYIDPDDSVIRKIDIEDIDKLHEDSCFDYPPTYADIEWPFKLPEAVEDEKTGDVEIVTPEIPETFYWRRKKYYSKLRLSYVLKKYILSVDNKNYFFILQKDKNDEYIISDPEDCVWVDNEGNMLRYNDSSQWWNILSKDEEILYHTKSSHSFNQNLHLLKWYDLNNEEVSFSYDHINSDDKIYLADELLNPYRRKGEGYDERTDTIIFTTKEKLAEDLHEQGVNFLTAYILANRDESAINRALYDTLINTFCVNVVDGKNINKFRVDLRGKLLTDINGNDLSFEKYLKQDYANDIIVLKGVLDLYDTSSDAATLYSRMIDTIMDTLLPKSSDLLTYGIQTVYYRYKKVIELFKSMTAYNLAYLDPQFDNFIDTKLSVHVSDFNYFSISKSMIDLSCIPEKLTNKIKQVWKPTYVDQDDVLNCTFTLSDDKTIDMQYKQLLLDYIDQIITILKTKKLSKAKKKQRLQSMLNRYKNDEEDYSDFIESIFDLPYDILEGLRNTKHRIERHTINVKTILRDNCCFAQDDDLLLRFSLDQDKDTDDQYKQIISDYIDDMSSILLDEFLSEEEKAESLESILIGNGVSIDYDDFVTKMLSLPKYTITAFLNAKHCNTKFTITGGEEPRTAFCDRCNRAI